MDEEKAKLLALFFGGEAWKTGGSLWVVLLKRSDGRLVVIGESAVSEFEDFEAYEDGIALAEILLQ